MNTGHKTWNTIRKAINENKEAHAAEDHKAPATQRADAWRAALEKAMEAANSKMQ